MTEKKLTYTYNDVRWMLDEYNARQAGPLRWRVETFHVFDELTLSGRVKKTRTLQELWKVGDDEYEWRDIEEVTE